MADEHRFNVANEVFMEEVQKFYCLFNAKEKIEFLNLFHKFAAGNIKSVFVCHLGAKVAEKCNITNAENFSRI